MESSFHASHQWSCSHCSRSYWPWSRIALASTSASRWCRIQQSSSRRWRSSLAPLSGPACTPLTFWISSLHFTTICSQRGLGTCHDSHWKYSSWWPWRARRDRLLLWFRAAVDTRRPSLFWRAQGSESACFFFGKALSSRRSRSRHPPRSVRLFHRSSEMREEWPRWLPLSARRRISCASLRETALRPQSRKSCSWSARPACHLVLILDFKILTGCWIQRWLFQI